MKTYLIQICALGLIKSEKVLNNLGKGECSPIFNRKKRLPSAGEEL